MLFLVQMNYELMRSVWSGITLSAKVSEASEGSPVTLSATVSEASEGSQVALSAKVSEASEGSISSRVFFKSKLHISRIENFQTN